MRIVIDLQGAQSESRYRGIGRYSLSISKAIARNRGEHEIIIALSNLFSETIEDIKQEFKDLLPEENIKVWDGVGPVKECETRNEQRREISEVIREVFLSNLKPDIVLITSFFEGYVDDAVTSIKKFDIDTKIAVILYDLIPYIHKDKYLVHNELYTNHYLKKIEYFKNADLLLGISDSSLKEAIDYLNFDENLISNISSAVDESFLYREMSDNEKDKLLDKYNISKKTIVYAPGGFDIRKNFENLINAYAILPNQLKEQYQLVIVSKIDDGNKNRLLQLAKDEGLDKRDLILTGYVSDEELISFYSICDLFVFTSIHEGFGLPVLEAMNCGAVVIGSNVTSIPEVIGIEEALFDPYSIKSIANKMEEVLEDSVLQQKILEHNKEQIKKFSWDKSAKIAIEFMENIIDNSPKKIHKPNKKKLAYFSPLQPQKSGISDYSAELLPYLQSYYDITLIVENPNCETKFQDIEFDKKNINWFSENYEQFDRVLYQMGNNPFHTYMIEAISKITGVVVLHDFFLSGLYAYEEMEGHQSYFWTKELYTSHGYTALQKKYNNNMEEVKLQYPVNLTTVNKALGMITHSDFSKELFLKYYGKDVSKEWSKIPLLRVFEDTISNKNARNELQLKDDDFLVCSFGFLDFTKLNHRLIDAFYHSKLSKDKRCKIIFVGENHGGDYGKEIKEKIDNYGLNNQVLITGWTDMKIFKKYLLVADVAVQLRTYSRGETSAAVLDSMHYGVATIVNANGSMSELSQDSVYMLEDNFKNFELIQALEKLYDDQNYRKTLGENSRKIIKTQHDPEQCALQYYETIEKYYNDAIDDQKIFRSIAENIDDINNEDIIKNTAKALSLFLGNSKVQKQILFDVSSVARDDLRTGIERVVRSQLLELLKNPPQGYRIEPIYLTDENGYWHYKYAREYTSDLLKIPKDILTDEIVEIKYGDIFYCADFYRDGIIEASKAGLFRDWRNFGVKINFVVYDLLPILMSDCFPKDSARYHSQWLKSILKISDNLICISEAVSNELKIWIDNNNIDLNSYTDINYVHLGADIESSNPTTGILKDGSKIIKCIKEKISFIMVGTLEPRKGHLQVIEAFTKLWKNGNDINLVIVGKEGWKGLPDSERRTIPKILDKIKKHSELDKKLFWLAGISDEYLQKVYEASDCLIAASEGEGFGLPLIEAAQYKLPIIARDIPVFREVAGEFTYYFENDNSSDKLAKDIQKWIKLFEKDTHPKSDDMPWLTWEESTRQLVKKLLGEINATK